MKTSNVEASKLFNSIDLFKFIAAILVVVIHTHPFGENPDVDYYITCFCRISVPFFFITTSFFFFRKAKPDIKSYTKRLSILYLSWFIIELPLVYYRFFVAFDHPLPIQILNLFRSLVFSNTWAASWYIMASIIAVNIVWFLSRKISNKNLLLLAGGGYMIALLSGSYYGIVECLINKNLFRLFNGFVWLFCPTNSFIVALIYIVIGKIAAESDCSKWSICQSRKTIILCLLVLFVLGALEMYLIKWSVRVNDVFVILPPFVLLVFLLLIGIDITVKPTIARWLRNMSILIYLIHPFLVVTSSIYGFMEIGMKFFFIILSISITLATTIIALSNKIPLLKKLY